MSESVVLTAPRPTGAVLIDFIPTLRDRTATLVVGGALLTAAASQVRIPLGFTPVPINLATFAAVLVGGALGARRAAISMGLFLICGIVGLPFFADASSGWNHFSGATGGYLVGYLVMAVMVGLVAEHGRDRRAVPFVAAVVLANAVLYVIGAAWLAHVVGVPFAGGGTSGWSLGIRPFLAGDLVKMMAAGLLFPTAWRFVQK